MQSQSQGEQNAPDVTASAEQKTSKKAASAFKTISEVADLLNVQQHVLRFWETKFSQVRPLKRGGGRRYYRPEDVALLQSIHHLLYTDGYTIKGVQRLLKEQGKNKVVQNNKPVEAKATPAPSQNPAATVQKVSANSGALSAHNRDALQSTLSDLRAMKALLAKSA